MILSFACIINGASKPSQYSLKVSNILKSPDSKYNKEGNSKSTILYAGTKKSCLLIIGYL